MMLHSTKEAPLLRGQMIEEVEDRYGIVACNVADVVREHSPADLLAERNINPDGNEARRHAAREEFPILRLPDSTQGICVLGSVTGAHTAVQRVLHRRMSQSLGPRISMGKQIGTAISRFADVEVSRNDERQVRIVHLQEEGGEHIDLALIGI